MTTALNMVKNRQYANEKLFGVRHVQCILCFFCMAMAYAQRVNLTVALVAMSDDTPANETAPERVSVDWMNLKVEYYNFTEDEKSYMLSSFFWGYVITQVPGGYIAQRYGAKMLLMVSLSLCAMLTLLTPMAVKYGGWMAMCVVRALEGLTQGAVHPGTHALLSKWAPANERGMLATICYSGAQFGTIMMLATSGIIATSPLAWPGIFYVSSLCCVVWVVFWSLFSASTPEKHRHISSEERAFIEKTRSAVKMQSAEHMAPVPWMSIMTSMPFLSLLIVHCTHMWGFWTLLTQIPSYMKNIYKVDIKSSALLSSLPYLVMMIMSFFFVWLSKVLENQKSVSLSFSRKIFNTIGHWIPMCALIGLGYVPPDNETLAVVLLTLAVGISAATYLGFQVNHIDLSPNYAGTLMGVTNAGANIMSAVAPLAVPYFLKDSKSVSDWRLVFMLAAFFYFIGNLLFLVFGRTEVQPWDTPDNKPNKSEQIVPLAPKEQRVENNV